MTITFSLHLLLPINYMISIVSMNSTSRRITSIISRNYKNFPGIPRKSTDWRFSSISSRNSRKFPGIRRKSTDWKITSIISRNSRDYTRGRILLTTSFTYCHISVTSPSYGSPPHETKKFILTR